MPEKASEIALSEDSLRYLGLDAAVGDTVSLDMRVSVMDGSLPEFEYCGKFILTGILESSYIGYSTGTVEGIVGNGTAEKLLPEKYLLYSTDFKTHDKKNFQSIVYDLAKNLDVEDRYIQYNWILLDAVGISYDETSNSDAGAGFSFMTVACVLVGLLVLFAAGLVIYNILKISITKRIKEYGTLRAIGGERGQIYRLVSLQLLILCGNILVGRCLLRYLCLCDWRSAGLCLLYLCRGCKDGCLTTGCRSRYCDYRGCCGFCCCLSAGNGDPAALYCKNEHC